MKKALVIGENINFAIELMNELNFMSSKVKVVGIKKKSKKDEKIIKDVDLVILLQGNIGMQLNKVNKIFVIVEKKESSDIEKVEENIYRIGFKNIEELIEIFLKMFDTETQDYELRKMIEYELVSLNYNLTHTGTKYLIESIEYIYKTNIIRKFNLTKDVYPIISKKYNVELETIKSDIMKATNYMDRYCDKEIKKNYFYCDNNMKPTAKLVMYMVLDKLQKKINKEKIKEHA